MTGENLYWVMYMYPWDADGCVGSRTRASTRRQNDGTNGLVHEHPGHRPADHRRADQAFGGRDWDMWLGVQHAAAKHGDADVGLKDKGTLQSEDNFNDGNYNGWTFMPVTELPVERDDRPAR